MRSKRTQTAVKLLGHTPNLVNPQTHQEQNIVLKIIYYSSNKSNNLLEMQDID